MIRKGLDYSMPEGANSKADAERRSGIIKRCLSGYPVDKKILSITEKSGNRDGRKRGLATGGRWKQLTTPFYEASGGVFDAVSFATEPALSVFTAPCEETGASAASFWVRLGNAGCAAASAGFSSADGAASTVASFM